MLDEYSHLGGTNSEYTIGIQIGYNKMRRVKVQNFNPSHFYY